MNIKDGWPAFPRPLSKLSSEEVSSDQEGMSLRDYFAAAALTGLLARIRVAEGDVYAERVAPADLAQTAYSFADALLAEQRRTT